MEHCWDLSRPDGETQGRLAAVGDLQRRGRYLRAVAVTVPELVVYAEGEQAVDCAACLRVLQQGILLDSCEGCSGS